MITDKYNNISQFVENPNYIEFINISYIAVKMKINIVTHQIRYQLETDSEINFQKSHYTIISHYIKENHQISTTI